VSTTGLMNHGRQVTTAVLTDVRAAIPVYVERPRSRQLLVGNHQLLSHLPEIQQLRRRCGQENDRTTDPEYFIAANTLANRRCAAVLIRQDRTLEACVLLYEHCRFGVGLGLFRGGDYIGEGLIAGAKEMHLQYLHMAVETLLKQYHVHGISLSVQAHLDDCIALMGPADHFRRFCGREIQHTLPLENSYQAMLASLGPRTRRSLAGKRKQLQENAHVEFVPALDPAKALEVMLALEEKAMPQRVTRFFHARERMQRSHPDVFSMGLRLPNGEWLSLLSGWRKNGVTYVDLQMNDANYKKESISAVMRAFMLEHEIGLGQTSVNFVGGSSLLLRRYCQPVKPCTDIFIAKPGLRSSLFEILARRVREHSVYDRLKPGVQVKIAEESEA
jgi:CRP-like cAMP-binding protein